jgi:hypothetical protein
LALLRLNFIDHVCDACARGQQHGACDGDASYALSVKVYLKN